MKKSTCVYMLIGCIAVFISALAVCLVNKAYLIRPVFQKYTTLLPEPSCAKYEKNGNLYIIDNHLFRLLCMSPNGTVIFDINIDHMEEYLKIYDCAADDAGNVYLYMMELEYDALVTKRDIIRKYDKNGKWVKDILVINYSGIQDAFYKDERPRAVPQFGSMRCENGFLTFSQVQKNTVRLYTYNIAQEWLSSSAFAEGGKDFSVGKLCLKDFDNFIYTTRSGDIFEVKNGAEPLLRASFNFSPGIRGGSGGIIPWYLEYGPAEGDILFYDMASGFIRKVDSRGTVTDALSRPFFSALWDSGKWPEHAGFGYWNGCFSGVFSDTVWFYDGEGFTSFTGDTRLLLPWKDRIRIIAAQVFLLAGAVSLILGLIAFDVVFLDGFISIFFKQAIVVIPVTIIAFIGFYTIIFNIVSEWMNIEIFRQLHMAATMSSKLINPGDIEAIKTLKDYESGTYHGLSQLLKYIIDENRTEWSRLFYSALYTGDNMEYYICKSNNEVNLFQPSIFESLDKMEILRSGKSTLTIMDYIDGHWAYSEKGIFNQQGELVGCLEIGIDMTQYHLKNAQLREKMTVIFGITCAGIMLVLILYTLVVVGRLQAIGNVLKAIGEGNYQARIKYCARDELGRLGGGLNNMADELQKQFEYTSSLNASSERFVPRQFMEYLGVHDITKLKLGDCVRCDLPVLFFDIRSFSIRSEIMSAQENFIFINKVFGLAGPIFRQYNGFVVKYLGDAAMVLFNDTASAVQAGIDLYHCLVLDRRTRITIDQDQINIGIGLHTGPVMMGIVGENERFSSTVISKNVNLASRLETLTKQTRSGMLVSRDAMNLIDDNGKIHYRFLGMIQVAGIIEVVGVCDILDALPPAVRKKRLATKRVFESAVHKYHTGDYEAASKRFRMVINRDPDDICAVNYLLESERRLENPELPCVFIFSQK